MKRRSAFWLAASTVAVGTWIATRARIAAPERPESGTRAAASEAGDTTRLDPAFESSSRSAAAGPVEIPHSGSSFRGTFVVEDVDERQWKAEDGFFDLALETEGGEETIHVEVHDGHWEAAVPAAHSVEIVRLVLGGRPAMPDDLPERQEWSESESIALDAYWPPSSAIRVLAADTGLELDRIEILREASDELHFSLAYPGPIDDDAMVARGAQSPVDLALIDARGVARGTQEYWVRAPDYAWQRFEVVFGLAGDLAVRLPPSGSLEVELLGPSPPGAATLRVWDIDPAPYDPEVEVSVDLGRRFAFDSIPVGRFRATVGFGRHSDEIILGSTEVEVSRGATTRATIQLTPAPEVRTARIRGVVVIPPEWAVETFTLQDRFRGTRIEGRNPPPIPMQEMVPLAGETGAFEFSMLVPLGKHDLQVKAGGWLLDRSVEVSEDLDVRIELPPAVPISLRFVDATTGGTAEIAWIKCWAVDERGTCQRAVQRPPSGADRFEFLAPRGEIRVDLDGDEGYELMEETTLLADESRVERTIPVSKVCGVELQLMEGKIPIRVVEALAILRGPISADATATETQRRMLFWRSRMRAPAPGLYVVEIRDLEDFGPLEPREVRIEAGRFTTVEFEAHRER